MKSQDTVFYLAAGLLGALAGFIDVNVEDLLFTALLVLAACMFLGLVRPVRPWRWALLVGVCVPVADLLAYFFLTRKPSRAQVYESVLVFLPGLVGAHGGAFGRRVVNDLLGGK